MKQTSMMLACVGVLTLLVAGVLLNSGCEEASNTESLTVEPSFADLSGLGVVGSASNSTFTQTFTVDQRSLRELSLPLTWHVSNPALGDISSAGGRSASYSRKKDAHGDNSVLVEDQYGAQGVATVRQ